MDLANTINKAFLSPVSIFRPLPTDFEPQQEDQSSLAPPFEVPAYSVYMKLSSLNSRKASGPDGIPARLMKENADFLADPVREILNCSFSEGRLPPSWKAADKVPIPKKAYIIITSFIQDR